MNGLGLLIAVVIGASLYWLALKAWRFKDKHIRNMVD